jgi:hypothetical protein
VKALLATVLVLAIALSVSAVTISGGSISTAHGSDISQFTIIKLRASAVRAVGPNGQTYGDFERNLTAVVDSRICAQISLSADSNTDSEGNKVLIVGSEDQPWACRQPTGSISFFVQSGYPLQGSLPITPGQTLMLNLSVEPPVDPGPVPPHQRFFVHLTLEADGKTVSGTGIVGQPPFLLIVPERLNQPLSVADTLPYLYPIEANGRLDLALPDEPHLATFNNTQLHLVRATESIAVQSSQLLEFPALRLSSLETKADLVVRLSAVSGQIGVPPQAVRAPQRAEGLAPPQVGDAGLK